MCNWIFHSSFFTLHLKSDRYDRYIYNFYNYTREKKIKYPL